MNISVLIPYEKASCFYTRWANEEERIDFENNAYEAVRCTLSYAASELCTYLGKLGYSAVVCDKPGENNIFITAEECENEEFDIINSPDGIKLSGCGRAGALYAVYEFLEAQGIRWYAPELEYVPAGGEELVIPEEKHYKYTMPKGRGFHTEGLLKESRKLMIWMSRNRMNLHSCHAHSVGFQKKLCMRFSAGGHVFADILNPNNIADNGQPYITAHRDWYGQRDEEITPRNAQAVQFCATNKELLDVVSDIFINRAQNEWKNEEIFEIAGFDTWGKSCNCENCSKLGNGSDIALHYISHIRKRIDEATQRGEIKRRIYLCFDVYEGTDTMAPPENPIPENLKTSGDYALFCPILRCFKHNIFDESCDRNAGYKKDFEGWVKSGFPVSINEYYDVSKFEDLPLLFTRTIYDDLRYYIKNGAERLVYMHIPMVEWGVCATTQYLLANVERDPDCDYNTLLDGYFNDVFGEYAPRAKEAYDKVETAMELCASWRSWGKKSVLGVLGRWDGKLPDKPFFHDSHFDGDAAGKGFNSVKLLEEALELMRGIRKDELENISNYTFNETNTLAVNPEQERRMQTPTVLLDKICEDIRGILYGIDMMKFMALFVEYYEELYNRNFEKAKKTFEKLEAQGTKMSEDTNGISFMEYPDFEVRDVLKRSRLKNLYYKCLANKNILQGK